MEHITKKVSLSQLYRRALPQNFSAGQQALHKLPMRNSNFGYACSKMADGQGQALASSS
jgi:hypothetical protein